MDVLNDSLNWAWARHQNPLSWYIRPLFILPFCYFAYVCLGNPPERDEYGPSNADVGVVWLKTGVQP